MSCSCGSSNSTIVDNYVTCLNCGNCSEYCPTYIMSYNNPRTHFRRCYYSRIKRFQKRMREMKSDVIGNHSEAILSMYGILEFNWNCSTEKTRKYFFSQKVVLYFILTLLGIELKVPMLKNADRTKRQLQSMSKLFSDDFRYSCGMG